MTTRFLKRKNEINRIITLLENIDNWEPYDGYYLKHKCGVFNLWVMSGPTLLQLSKETNNGAGGECIDFTYWESQVLWPHIMKTINKVKIPPKPKPQLSDWITVAENYKPE